MNNQNMMMQRRPSGPGLQDNKILPQADDGLFVPVHNNGMSMVRRGAAETSDTGVVEKKIIGADDIDEGPPAPEKKLGEATPAQSGHVGASRDELAEKTSAIKSKAASAAKQASPAKPAATAKSTVKTAAKPAPGPAPASAAAPKSIGQSATPDDLCAAYTSMFKSSLGLDLSHAIVFENMRRICEPDVRDPLKTLYFVENTYRLSTLLYLASNLPILVVTSILAEKNRKNILKYVSIEVENGSKPYDQLLDLRMKRWARKYENMTVNDAMTVTPGVTVPTKELADAMRTEFEAVSSKLRRFNAEMSNIVAKFDDGTRNDVIYIYSNWWYLLQGFENVPEMRSYVMAITDDTRRNLKL